MKHLALFFFLLIVNVSIAQNDSLNNQRTVRPFLSFMFLPSPTIVGIAEMGGGVKFKHEKWNHSFEASGGVLSIVAAYWSAYLKTSRTVWHVPFRERLAFNGAIPLWFASRNMTWLSFGEEGDRNFAALQIGTGVDMELVLPKRFSLNFSAGVGYGPYYSSGYSKFQYDRLEFQGWIPIPLLKLQCQYSF